MKASIDPKFSSNLVTQTDVELLVWRLAPSGFKKHAVVDMQKVGALKVGPIHRTLPGYPLLFTILGAKLKLHHLLCRHLLFPPMI